jgi:vacuolar-type H+-ATPase subunit I/STV1
MSPEKVFEFALKYCYARNVNLGEFAMADQVNGEVLELQDDGQIEDLRKEMATMRAALAEALESQQEASQQAEQYRAALDDSNERVAVLETSARDKRYADMSKGWYGDNHVRTLTVFAEAFGEDSDEFAEYVRQQNAVTAQLSESKLLDEFGTDRAGDDRSAASQLTAKADELLASNPTLTKAQAFAKAAELNPVLYAQHVDEMRGN